MDDATKRRLEQNELLARRVNDAIARGVWPGEGSRKIRFRCECALPECNTMLPTTATAYDRVRAEPNRFMVLPGHEVPDVDEIVGRADGFTVVAKRDPRTGL